MAILRTFQDSPQPTTIEVAEMDKAVKCLEEAEKEARTAYMDLVVAISESENEDTREAEKDPADKAWKEICEKISLLVLKATEYISKLPTPVPSPQAASNVPALALMPRNSPLERLSLPTFKGTKMDYLKFKQEIDKQRSKEHNHDRVCVALEALEQGLPRIEHEAAGNYYSDYDSVYGTEDDEPGGYYGYANFVKPKANEKKGKKSKRAEEKRQTEEAKRAAEQWN